MASNADSEGGSPELTDIGGVGPATADKLREANINTPTAVAAASPADLTDAGVGEDTAQKVVRNAMEIADIGGFEDGSEIMARRNERSKLQFRIPELDELLGGGIETQCISEFYGEFGAGKSQVTHQMAVNVQMPEEYGGLGRRCIFIDSEDTFRPERIDEMLSGLDEEVQEAMMEKDGISPVDAGNSESYSKLLDNVLDRIHVAKAFNSNHQILLAEKAIEIAEEYEDDEYPVGLLIIDSLTAHFRAEFVGRGELANRQQKLNKHLHDIDTVGKQYNAAVIVTNQVQSNPDAFFGDPTKPIGGNILGHKSTFRLYIKKSKPPKRVVKLDDAPNLPDGEAIMRVENEGLKPE